MLWIGTALLAGAVMCGLVTSRAQARVKAVRAVESSPVRDIEALCETAAGAVGPGPFSQYCEVVGMTRPGDDGLLRSVLAERDCVWHRHRISRKYRERYEDKHGNPRYRTRAEVVSEFVTDASFLVEDSTGTIAVRPGDQVIEGAEKVLDTFEPYDGGSRLSIGPLVLSTRGAGTTLGHQKEEWVLRSGARLFIHGEASDTSGVLVLGRPAEGETFVLTTRSEAALIRSQGVRVRVFGVATAVTGAVGAMLLIFSLFS